jgi:hypothetical protein
MDMEYEDNKLIYKGIPIGITREQMQDLLTYGNIDIVYYLEEMYKNNIVIIRDVKIDLILGK